MIVRRTVLLFWLAFASLAFAQDERKVELRYVDGRSDGEATFLQFESEVSDWWVASSDLAEILQVGRFWRLDVRKLVLKLGSGNVTFTVGARGVVAGDRTHMLRNEVRFHEGEPWIPLEFLTRVLPLLSDQAVSWDAEAMRLTVGVTKTNLVGLDVRRAESATELRIRMQDALAFLVDDSRPQELVVKIYGGVPEPSKMRLSSPNGLVNRVSTSERDGSAFVRIELSELASSYQSVAQDEGRTILLRIEQTPSSTTQGPQLVQTVSPDARGRKITVRKVIIDPGHGGADNGRVGKDGLAEKDITLGIAIELQRVLQRRSDLEVVLTREDDRSLGLIERTELANREGGDVLISLHCNGWYDAGARGVATWFLSPAKTEWDAELARSQDARLESAEKLDFMLWDVVQNLYVQESASLAEVVQNRLSKELDLDNRGVKQSGFRVLIGAQMPAVLVEIGFLTNPDEAKRLSSAGFQRDVAAELARAVLEFRDRMDAVREERR